MRRALPLLAGALLLAGCTGTPRIPATAGVPVDPALVTEWLASVRIGVASGAEGGSGSFNWRQLGSRTSLDVRGPLGAGGLHVEAEDAELSVTGADGARVDAGAAREAIRARLGVDLPLAELRYWMLGLPAPGSDAQVEGHAAPPARTISQAGWSVRYDEFVTAAGWSVPARLTATAGGVRLKAVIDDWRIATPAGAGPGVSR
jgi:outer membrane lipoprotein LolB